VAQALQLYQLQSLDSEIDKIDQELAEITANLGESESLQKTRQAAQSAEKDLRQAQTTMQDLDLEVKSLTTKIENQEKRLYSGKLLNAKEAANLQDEVASLKRWREQREESLLEAMLAVEAAEEALEQAQSSLSAVEAGWMATQEQLKQKQAALQTQRAELKERRPTLTHSLNSATLSEYESLRAKKAGRAVAAVKNGICQGCGMTPSQDKIRRARTGTEWVYCGACGRILYVA